jgi:hypothetical protein
VRRLAVVAALLLAPLLASAHTVAVRPVHVRLKADPGRLRLTVEVNALAWRFIAGVPVPSGEEPWAPEAGPRSMEYLRTHFPLSVDGRALEGRFQSIALAQPLWEDALGGLVVLRAVYDLPAGGTFTARADFYREDRDGLEGRGLRPAAGVRRDFRTFVRWSAAPGGSAVKSLEDPALSLPLERLLRSGAGRAAESAWAGALAVLRVGGGAALLFVCLLFPGRWTAVFVAAGAAAGAGLVAAGLSPPPAVLWGAAAAAALSSVRGRSRFVAPAAAAVGAACAVPLWAAEGAAYRDATGFVLFSPAAFAAGVVALTGASWGARAGIAAFYRFHFRYLTPDELSRQAGFHRLMAALFVAVAGGYWLLAPLWRAR